jgi:hypothetical protein
MKTIDPVGQLDIARRLGYPRATVVQWLQRGVFDVAPKWTVSDAPVWNWPDVLAWAKETGRDGRMMQSEGANK